MTAIALYARLVKMTDNSVLATTTNLLKWSITRQMDKPGPRSITVPAGDPGDSSDSSHGFANAALAAVGGAGVTAAPVPTLCEGSFDGGTTIDFRFMVESVVPDMHGTELVLTLSGDDSGTLYNSIGPDRWPAIDIKLCDVLGGNAPGGPGEIIPKDAAKYGISTTGAIPSLQGVLVPQPGQEPIGSPMWASGASGKVALQAVVSNDLSSAMAELGVSIDSWEDSAGRLITTLVKQLGGVFFGADSYDQGSRGHSVWCDSDVNLSGDIAGVVCDGTPFTGSYPTAAGQNGYSNDATNHPHGIPRALVIGNVGGNPHGHAFTLDATSTAAVPPANENTTARLHAEETTLQPDLSTLMGEVRLYGGTSDAGIPQGAVLTSIITLNNQPVEGSPPYISWQDVLPIAAANQGDVTGQIYYDAGDYRLRPLPSWTLALPVYDLQVDNQNGVIYAATSQGVWSHSTSGLATSTGAWTRVGGLTYKVTRLNGVGGAAGAFWLYALVSGVSTEADGIYQYAGGTLTAYGQTGVGYDYWIRFLSKEKLVSMAAVSGSFCFFLTTADQQAQLWGYDATSSTTPYYTWTLATLDTGAQATRVDRVITAGGQDSVWVSTSGGSQAGQYILASAGSYIGQSLKLIDHDGSLATAVQTATGTSVAPQINRAISLGYGIGSPVVTVAVMLCTNVGVYYMPTNIPSTGGANWSPQCNGMNGLAGFSITNLVAGQQTSIPNPNDPTGYVLTNRLYAISGNSYYFSYSSGRWWRDLLRFPLTAAPWFYAAAESILSDLPSYAVQTIGPMASSPIGGPSGSHIQITSGTYALPSGWYWRRRWSYTREPFYALVNSNVAYPQVYDEQVTELAVTPSVPLGAAAATLALFFILLLGEHSTKQTTLTGQANFTQQESGLRYLWPTHAAAWSQVGQIKALSSEGELVTSYYINLSGVTFYVLSVTLSGEGPQYTAQVTVGTTVRGTPMTGADLAAALVQDQRRIRVHGLRSKH